MVPRNLYNCTASAVRVIFSRGRQRFQFRWLLVTFEATFVNTPVRLDGDGVWIRHDLFMIQLSNIFYI